MYDELIKSLRQCAEASCAGCKNDLVQIGCRGLLQHEAADAIEERDRHILTLQHEMMAEAESHTALVERLNKQIERLAKNSQKVDNGFGEWISVTEWLPKADEYDAHGYAVPYLVMNGWMRVTARRTKDYWVLFGDGTVLDYVTHWMPLPEPPKEG